MALEEEVEVELLPVKGASESIDARWHRGASDVTVVLVVDESVHILILVFDVSRSYQASELRDWQSREEIAFGIEVLLGVEPEGGETLEGAYGLACLGAVGSLDAVRLVYLYDGVLRIGEGAAKGDKEIVFKTLRVAQLCF